MSPIIKLKYIAMAGIYPIENSPENAIGKTISIIQVILYSSWNNNTGANLTGSFSPIIESNANAKNRLPIIP